MKRAVQTILPVLGRGFELLCESTVSSAMRQWRPYARRAGFCAIEPERISGSCTQSVHMGSVLDQLEVRSPASVSREWSDIAPGRGRRRYT